MDDEWLERIQRAMAIDIARFQTAGLPPMAITKKLWEIPEVAEAFELLRNRRRG